MIKIGMMNLSTEIELLDAELETLFARRMKLLGAQDNGGHMMSTLFSTITQIDTCQRTFAAAPQRLLEQNPVHRLDKLPPNAVVACAGVEGAYGHIACERLFAQPHIHFYEQFEDVFRAVSRGEVEYGVLPVENSSAGQVGQVLEHVSVYNFYVNSTVQIKCEHCLCVRPGTHREEIAAVLSHPQALAQSRRFLEREGLVSKEYSNTAAAAKLVSESSEKLACICSTRGARLHNLTVLQENIQDFDENYTRFMCISARNILLPGADTVSITLAFPNEPGYLNKLLTRFAVCNLDLSKIQSMPIASRDFDVRFHLDFAGSIEDERVIYLLGGMYEEFKYFKFLGNFLTKGESDGDE